MCCKKRHIASFKYFPSIYISRKNIVHAKGPHVREMNESWLCNDLDICFSYSNDCDGRPRINFSSPDMNDITHNQSFYEKNNRFPRAMLLATTRHVLSTARISVHIGLYQRGEWYERWMYLTQSRHVQPVTHSENPYPADTHLVSKTSLRQRFQCVQNSEYVDNT